MVGWVEERNPTKSLIMSCFTITQPNPHFLNRQVLKPEMNPKFLENRLQYLLLSYEIYNKLSTKYMDK